MSDWPVELVRGVVAFCCLILMACDVGPVAERRFEKKEDRARRTSILRAADLAGHDGRRLTKSGEALIDAGKKRNEELERALQGNQ